MSSNSSSTMKTVADYVLEKEFHSRDGKYSTYLYGTETDGFGITLENGVWFGCATFGDMAVIVSKGGFKTREECEAATIEAYERLKNEQQ